jgi:peptidoglycan/LPS O-acetylase OafA/YrhL
VSITRGFIRELDGLRGIAISLVLVHRFWPDDGPLKRFASLAELGWVGVDLFFVISGFLIAGILLDTKHADVGRAPYFKNFYARRMLRIFPLYYLFVGAVLIAFPLAQGGPYFETPFIRSAGSPLYYLCYLGNVPEAIGHDPPYFLAPVWSLAIEEQFYIVFPFLVWVLPKPKLGKVLLALILLAPLFRFAVWLIAPGNERIQYLSTPCRMDSIAMGCMVALIFRTATKLPSAVVLGRVACGLLVACAATFLFGGLSRVSTFGKIGGYSLVAVTFAAVVAFVVTSRDTAAVAWLRWRPLTYLGKICYGTYLLHRPADFLVDKVTARFELSQLLVIGFKFVVAIALASLSWYVFESRVLRLKRWFESKDHPMNATAPAPQVDRPAASPVLSSAHAHSAHDAPGG